MWTTSPSLRSHFRREVLRSAFPLADNYHMTIKDRPFWSLFLSIAIIGTITWLAIFEHNYHPRIDRYSEDVTILHVGDSELDFNHAPGAFRIWWQSGRRNMRVWPR